MARFGHVPVTYHLLLLLAEGEHEQCSGRIDYGYVCLVEPKTGTMITDEQFIGDISQTETVISGRWWDGRWGSFRSFTQTVHKTHKVTWICTSKRDISLCMLEYMMGTSVDPYKVSPMVFKSRVTYRQVLHCCINHI